MKYVLTTFLIFCLTANCFGDDLRKKAEENPLDCVYYLLSKSDDNYKHFEVASLSEALWRINRREDAIRATDLDGENVGEQITLLIKFAEQVLKEGKKEEAKKILLKAFRISKNQDVSSDIYYLSPVVKSLVSVNLYEEAIEIAEVLEDKDDKTTLLILIAEGYLQNQRTEKALELLPQILQYSEESQYEDYKTLFIASAGLLYAKAQQEEKALEFLEKATYKINTVEFSDSFRRVDAVTKIIDGFAAIGQCDRAYEVFQTNIDPNDSFDVNEASRNYISVCNDERAKMLKSQIEMAIEGEHNLVILNLEKGNLAKALSIAKSNELFYRQDDALIAVADAFLKIGKKQEAIDALSFALNQIRKIKSDEPESGYMSTSPAYEKAHDLAKIADKFMDISRFDLAFDVISSIEKPFIRANKLADFAARHTGAKGKQKAFAYLSQALKIARKDNDEILDAYWETLMLNIAKSYALLNAKDKAVDVLTEILEKHDEWGDSTLMLIMCEVGYQFDKHKLKANERMKKALREIIESMED